MKKRILLISNRNPFSYPGGLEYVIFSLANSLKSKYNITIICRDHKELIKKISGFKYIQCKCSFAPIVGDEQYASQIKRITEINSYDLIIDNGAIGFKINCKKNIVISICHGTNIGVCKSLEIKNLLTFAKKIYRAYWARRQAAFLKKCSKVVSLTPKVKKEIVDYYKIPSQKICIISNGTYIKINKKRMKDRKFKNSALFVSNDHERKGLDIIEKIGKQMPDFSFNICGSEYRPRTKNLKYIGMLKKNDLEKEMTKYDFFIFPSRYEGQSLAVLDAMAVGLPLVISKESNPGIKNGINGYLCERDPDEFIHAIKKLYCQSDKLDEISRNNIKFMATRTWEQIGKKYMELIEICLSSPKQS